MEYLQSIQSVFKDQLFTVPDYQRGYAWAIPENTPKPTRTGEYKPGRKPKELQE
jgi:hypothetical protein